MIGFIDIRRCRRGERKTLELQFQTVDPESMFNEMMSPRLITRNTFYPKRPLGLRSSNQRLAVRPESLPTAIMCVNMISQPW
jgi:hypothetical protein